MTFPLYRLPYVALSNLISFMKPNEIFRLSLVSKKSYRVCKSMRKKPKKLRMLLGALATIDVDWKKNADDDFMLFFVEVLSPKESNSSSKKLESLKINNTMVKLKMDDTSMFIYWPNDIFDGLKTLSEYANRFYDQPFHSMCIGEGEGGTEWRRVLDWILSRQETLPQCSFGWRISVEEEDLRYFFDAIGNRITNYLNLDLKLESENFRYNFSQSITTDCIEFESSPWLTIDNLLQLNCRCLFLQNTNLTSENLNFFLRNWLNGRNSNLGFWFLRLKSFSIEVILNGLEVIVRDHPNGIKYHLYYKDTLEFGKSYELRRNDGKIASIVIHSLENKELCMCVWPDFNGKPYPVQELEE
ncbi:unnamed protein product [Caenorhabditis brenneri]